MNSPIPKARQTDREVLAETFEIDPTWLSRIDDGRIVLHLTDAQFAILREALSAPPPQEVRWVSVEERLPGEQGCDSEDVLCFLNGHCAITDNECRSGGGWGTKIGFFDAERQCFRVHGRPESFVTHWQPRPSAPKEQAA